MKKLENLTRRERNAYISTVHCKESKRLIDEAKIKYLFENNTVEEITEWFNNKSSTISFEGADLISVYMYNRISKMLNK